MESTIEDKEECRMKKKMRGMYIKQCRQNIRHEHNYTITRQANGDVINMNRSL